MLRRIYISRSTAILIEVAGEKPDRFLVVVHLGKISHFVRDDSFLFLCHFERMREIFPRLRLGEFKLHHYPEF